MNKFKRNFVYWKAIEGFCLSKACFTFRREVFRLFGEIFRHLSELIFDEFKWTLKYSTFKWPPFHTFKQIEASDARFCVKLCTPFPLNVPSNTPELRIRWKSNDNLVALAARHLAAAPETENEHFNGFCIY